MIYQKRLLIFVDSLLIRMWVLSLSIYVDLEKKIYHLAKLEEFYVVIGREFKLHLRMS